MLNHTNQVRIERIGPLTLFDVRGYVSMDAGPSIIEAYDIIDPELSTKILLRFDEDTFFNSEGIKVMLDILVGAMKNSQQVGIVGLSKHFKKIFHMVGITKLATIFESGNEALKGLGLDETKTNLPEYAGEEED